MHSCIYLGQVRHRRFQPVEHQFQYRLFQMYLDLDELPELFDPYWLWSSRRPALAWFRRRDHLGDARLPLAEAVRDGVQQQTGHRPKGPIRLLTHLRYWGYGFNPVSFYYCFAPDGSQLEAIVAEINNTPWGEQYSYVLEVRDSPGNFGHLRFEFSKCFHVSPFMPLEIRYRWHFTTPGPRLAVHMENWKAGHKIFDATLALQRREIGHRSLSRVLMQYPVMTVRVITAIYYQALGLWLKKSPFYPHPGKREATNPEKPL